MHTYSGRFEHIKLSHDDLTDSSLYEDAVKGVYAIVHSPTVAYLNQPPKDVWAKTADSVLSMLDAAKGEKSVQAFVYTSSIAAVTSLSTPSEAPVLVTEDSWNAKDVVLALTGKHNDHVVHDSALVYTEQSLWHWQDKQCPHFKINVISPSNLIGQNFAPHRTLDWQNWLLELYRNGQATEVIPNAGPTQAHWYVDVADVALLHVAAIFDPDIAGERLHAWGCFRDWNDAIAVMRNLEPDVPDVTQPFFIGDDGSKRGGLYTRPGRVPAILKKWNRGEG
ncbi:hypothetical protein NEMBOFW57_002074 [Staphylotrichum longicolle]|uniref:3-beta hydroxysteroid dehydrogenase/isomerase domain-containing protein n=1 Tax=Staphylotrichum longicolle TaxID=669026 RepID=A0AAD4F7A6_9PEZI|nr:hypothetical protein NEMBOFW57_002074 [Staphylotrichum longicolle]